MPIDEDEHGEAELVEIRRAALTPYRATCDEWKIDFEALIRRAPCVPLRPGEDPQALKARLAIANLLSMLAYSTLTQSRLMAAAGAAMLALQRGLATLDTSAEEDHQRESEPPQGGSTPDGEGGLTH